jgi:hypothetical protein
MAIIYKIESEIDEKLDEFLEKNGDYAKKLFSSSDWLKFVKEMYKYSFLNILFYREKEVVGFIPFFLVKSVFFGKRLISLPFSGHGGGFCLKKNLEKKEIEEILKLLITAVTEIRKKEKIESVTIREINVFFELYKNIDYVFGEKEYTFLIPLTTEQEIWKNLNKKVRNGIRKAEKEGLKCNIENSIDSWHLLHKKTMKRLGTPPVKRGHLEEIKKRFGNNLLVFFAEYQGKKIGDVSFVIKNDCMFWSTNDCLENYRNLNVSNFLLFEGIKYGLKKGYKFLDMGVSRENSNNFGFKKKWNPKLADTSKKYYFFGKKKFISPNEKKYHFFSDVWKKMMPEFLANIVGPRIRRGLGS